MRLQPADAAEGARWLTMTSWQGQEASVVQHLKKTGEGTYHTVEPVPVDGTWKTILRLHRVRQRLGDAPRDYDLRTGGSSPPPASGEGIAKGANSVISPRSSTRYSDSSYGKASTAS